MDGPTGEHPSPEEAGVWIVVAGATEFAGGATLTRPLNDDRVAAVTAAADRPGRDDRGAVKLGIDHTPASSRCTITCGTATATSSAAACSRFPLTNPVV